MTNVSCLPGAFVIWTLSLGFVESLAGTPRFIQKNRHRDHRELKEKRDFFFFSLSSLWPFYEVPLLLIEPVFPQNILRRKAGPFRALFRLAYWLGRRHHV